MVRRNSFQSSIGVDFPKNIFDFLLSVRVLLSESENGFLSPDSLLLVPIPLINCVGGKVELQ